MSADSNVKTDTMLDTDSNPAFKEDTKRSKLTSKQIGGERWEVILSKMKSPSFDLQKFLVSSFKSENLKISF